MRHPTILLVTALMAVTATTQAADLYLDNNGTDSGFALNWSDVIKSSTYFSFTNNVWNTDPAGGAGGSLTNVSNGDTLHFGVSSNSVMINLLDFEGVEVGGLYAFQDVGSDDSAAFTIRKNGGGAEYLHFASNAVVNCDGVTMNWAYDFATVGDFTVTGDHDLNMVDGAVKVDGICTLSSDQTVETSRYQSQDPNLSSSSDFTLNSGATLNFDSNLFDTQWVPKTVEVGTFRGSGTIDRAGSGATISPNLSIEFEGVGFQNGAATDSILIDEQFKMTMTPTAASTFEISKAASVTACDTLNYRDFSDANPTFHKLTVDGALTVELLAGSDALTDGDEFELIAISTDDSNNLNGVFDSVSLPTLDAGLAWDMGRFYVDGILRVVSGDAVLPAAPANLNATNGEYSVTLDWDANSEADFSHYAIMRSRTQGNGYERVGSTVDTEYVDTFRSEGGYYYYQVVAVDTLGNESVGNDEIPLELNQLFFNTDWEHSKVAWQYVDLYGYWKAGQRDRSAKLQVWPKNHPVNDSVPASSAFSVRAFPEASADNYVQQSVAGSAGTEYSLVANVKPNVYFRGDGYSGQIFLELGFLGTSGLITNMVTELAFDDWAITTNTMTAPAGTTTVRGKLHWTSSETKPGGGPFFDRISLYKTSAGYEAWSGGWGVDIGATTNDYDNDGANNLYEYGLGGDPTKASDVGTLPVYETMQLGGGSNVFTYVYVEQTDPSAGLDYYLNLSPSLSIPSWTNTGYSVSYGSPSDGFRDVTNTIPVDVDSKFINLIIEEL
ncbi:phage tail protein [Pontiella sulfatireligans]|uniref:Fibronectin type-III domain-containing protein n=1 Tax=Pontiella sulfatireligans TaxID=2750658 RepID=A0A6C2UNT0_9BACT|nr:hypothetical protein [Pontiella sulfatireligans]VGO21940.1 hypothetical protein SCARR_04020 [Pontiella sulfatireligans]